MVPEFVENFTIRDDAEKMPYSPLGKTGIKISKLSLGGAVFGGAKFYGDYERSEAEQTVITALKKGINLIDVAPLYGFGVSESFLGEILKKVPRNAYYISTKVGRPGNYFNFEPSAIIESLNQSLQRLQLDYVDIVYVHDVEFADSIDIILDKTLPAMENLVKAGKTKFIGISGYPVSTLLEIVKKSKVKIDCVLTYARDTLIDNTLQDFLTEFQTRGVGVLNAACIGMRLLSNAGPPSWHPASKETKDICRAAANYCHENGVELGRLALYHSLNQPGSSTCLVGMNDFSTLKANFEVLYNGLTNQEFSVLQHIQKNILNPDERRHWEGVEVKAYRENKLDNYN